MAIIPYLDQIMLAPGAFQLHQNDRQELARKLFLSLPEFDRLVQSANHAYEVIKDLGPFYGKEEFKDPTFRITAEPVLLPEGSHAFLTQLGNDIFSLAKVLRHLPDYYKNRLGNGLDFRVPPAFRVDAILDEKNTLLINEIECADGADALMTAEQLAYDLQRLEDSTQAHLVQTYKSMCKSHKKGNSLRLLLIRSYSSLQHTTNAMRAIRFMHELSRNSVAIDHVYAEDIQEGISKPSWHVYDGIICEKVFSVKDIQNFGVPEDKILAVGNYNAIANKAVFALLFEKSLQKFWTNTIGEERLARLQSAFIPTAFIESVSELEEARKRGKVVKISWANGNTALINRSKGVALPEGNIEQSSEERWELLRSAVKNDMILIAQDFVLPAMIDTFLRKKGTSLERVSWYNRICVKYVSNGNPNGETCHSVTLTAAEATLGPDIVPAGRKSAFTAAKLA